MDSNEDTIITALRRIIRAIDVQSHRLEESCGLTGPQLAVLRAAKRLGGPPGNVLARTVHLSHPTVTGIVDRLARRSLIRRVPDESDRRRSYIVVTEAGEDLLARAPSLLQDRFRTELSRLQEWEQSLMLAILQRIASMMDADSIDASPVLITGSVQSDGEGWNARNALPVSSEVAGAGGVVASALEPGLRTTQQEVRL